MEKRKQRNRESAARSRKRSRERMIFLEHLVGQLTQKNRRLEQAVRLLSVKQARTDANPTDLFGLSNFQLDPMMNSMEE
jgi:hypothetical protein